MAEQSNIDLLDTLRIASAMEKEDAIFTMFQDIQKHHGQTDIHKLQREILEDGSNTIARWVRLDTPVDYDEIVYDVAKKIGLKPARKEDVAVNESEIITKMVNDYWDKLSDEERSKIVEQISKDADIINKLGKTDTAKLLAQYSTNAIQALIILVGQKTASKFVTRMVASYIGKQGAKWVVGEFIPFLNIILTIWLVLDLAGPAYRKTIPTVIEIALIRNMLAMRE